MSHDVECVVLRIGNKNGSPYVGVTCFLVEVTCFFHKSDLQDDRSLAELCGSLLPLKKVRVQNGAHTGSFNP